ncbi:MAG: STM4011 family radical SAM protein [Bradymonadia bacterium]
MRLLVWRGHLVSCNYACGYCPFAKRKAELATLRRDREALDRFVAHVASDPTPTDVLIMPWGEAMIWPWYPEALAALARLPHVRAVGIQTNGSFPARAVASLPPNVQLWISWHPTQIERSAFTAAIQALLAQGNTLSVGTVAAPEHLDALEQLRRDLDVPMWVNARKPGGRYTPEEIVRFYAIDPDFELELRPVRSRGKTCATGHDVWMVEADGTIPRCHLIPTPLGNLYEGGAAPQGPCTRAGCHCFVGYAFLEEVGVWRRWGERFVGRRR